MLLTGSTIQGGAIRPRQNGSLYFMKHEGIFWRDTSFVEELRPDELK